MNIKKTETIGSIVTQNIQAAEIFNEYDIDYACQGERTLEHVCIEENVPIMNVLEELWELDGISASIPNFDVMSIDKLARHITNIHHRYTEKKITFIRNHIERLERKYGGEHLELLLIKKTFEEMSIHVLLHMKNEEFFIFPCIRRMVSRGKTEPTTSIEKALAMMEGDHELEGDSLRQLADLTNHYNIPEKSDYEYRVTYGAMKELEKDLRVHMHLENNILFPKAIKMENILKHIEGSDSSKCK